MFQSTAPGVTGPGTAVPNHVVVGLRMEQGWLLSPRNMEAANAQENQLPLKAATPKSAQVNNNYISNKHYSFSVTFS